MRNPQLNEQGELKHLLTIDGLPRRIVENILDTAASFVSIGEREVKKVPLLRGKSVFNLFFENSTRTRTTFEIAAKRLSADVLNLNINASSTSKGESLLDTINNLLIVAPPKPLQREQGQDRTRLSASGALDVDFLKETGLVNALEAEEKQFFQDRLSQNLLNTDLLPNILDLINAQMAAELNLLNTAQGGLLPDYRATSGVTVSLDEPTVTLCRDDGSNTQCVSTRTSQNVTILQVQGSVEIKNRVNAGGSTSITLIQR